MGMPLGAKGSDPCMGLGTRRISAFLQTNDDVQLPFRFASTAAIHNTGECDRWCAEMKTTRTVCENLESSQGAQVGYACDYQNKRAARSYNEVKMGPWQISGQLTSANGT